MSPILRFTVMLILGIGGMAASLAQDSELAVLVNEPRALDGYTFLAPIGDGKAYVIDNAGRVVNEWEFGVRTREIHLLDNGNVMVSYGAREELDKSLISLGYDPDGAVAEYTWEGELVWEYQFLDPKKRHHHGIDILPNGNILALVWDYYHLDDALAMGLDPVIVEQVYEGIENFLPDSIVEIDKANGEIVWIWEAWDHLVQNIDNSLPNYGSPADHVRRLDINYQPYASKDIPSSWGAGPADWMHGNSVNYSPQLDQLVLSVLRFDEIWIIDASPTVEEAAGPAGDLLYRWGNPFAYRHGDMVENRQLFQQHDAQWIEAGLPGAGNLLIYNNRNNVIREDEIAEDEYSSILELKLPLLDDGRYDWDAEPEIVWQYDEDFYSRIISGVQRLPNGNTLITEGVPGRLIEVTADGEVVWEFVYPVDEGSMWLFRVRKYAADHPGFAGKDLIPGAYIGT